LSRSILLSIILLFFIGFSSNVFAVEDTILFSESNFDSPFNYNLIDNYPIKLDQFTINPTSDFVSFTDVSSTNFSDNLTYTPDDLTYTTDDLTYTTKTSSPNSVTLSETDLDNGDEINNLLGMLLFVIPFAALVFRMSDDEPLSKKNISNYLAL